MSIKKLLVLSILVYLAVFLSQTGAGLDDNKAYAYVYITIADAPPRIRSIAVAPELAYTDSEIFCEADVYDENMSFLQVKYSWLINDELMAGSKDKFLETVLQAGDEIACKIIATDVYGHVSQETSQSIEIQPQGILQVTGYTIRNIREGEPQAKGGLAAGSAIMLGSIIIVLGFSLKESKKF